MPRSSTDWVDLTRLTAIRSHFPMYVLRIVSGPAAGQFVELDGELVIGRESGGLDIGDPQLSRRHAAVRLRGDTVVVEDLGSRNGTYVNGARINRPTRLR